MSIFDDINRFLETRLDEFLRKNPHLELQALEEQLREQEKDTLRLLISLQNEQKSLDAEINCSNRAGHPALARPH